MNDGKASVFVNSDADICHTWHDFPFHIMLDDNMKRVAFCQTDGVDMESILVMIDACASDAAFFVDQMTVEGIVMTIA